MLDELKRKCDELADIQRIEEYRLKIEEIADFLNGQNLSDASAHMRRLSDVQINKFSKDATREAFELSKKQVLDYLNTLEKKEFSERESVRMVQCILENFEQYCKNLYGVNIHQKCSESLKKHLPYLKIENEYDVQHLMYSLVSALFHSARLEEVEDTGHHMIRKDIVIDEHDIVIELKCSGGSTTERKLSEEIASDIVHYGNKHLFFFVYDKDNVIHNVDRFIYTYESKNVENKKIYIYILQPTIM